MRGKTKYVAKRPPSRKASYFRDARLRKREKVVRSLGFRSYGEYLNSALWYSIRKRVFEAARGLCYGCGRMADQAHHGDYGKAAVTGEDISRIYAVCHACHFYIENKNGDRIHLERANQRLEELRKRNFGTCVLAPSRSFIAVLRGRQVAAGDFVVAMDGLLCRVQSIAIGRRGYRFGIGGKWLPESALLEKVDLSEFIYEKAIAIAKGIFEDSGNSRAAGSFARSDQDLSSARGCQVSRDRGPEGQGDFLHGNHQLSQADSWR